MTRVPFLDIRTHPNPTLFQNAPNTYLSMGLSVEALARKYGITREQADAFALQSHQKAIRAQDLGWFEDEIVPVQTEIQEVDAQGRPVRVPITVSADEGPRPRHRAWRRWRASKPAFRADGVITAGNASQRSDGAAAVLVMSERKANALGVNAGAVRGLHDRRAHPEDFGVAPAYAIPKLLKRYALQPEDIDHIEFNEAFAAQVLASQQIYPLPMERVNPLGGGDCAGASAGLHRRATGGDAGVRSPAHRRTLRAGHDVRRALRMGAAGLFERVA